MENRVNPLHELFARSSTPPVQRTQPLIPPPVSSNSSPSQIDSIFHQLRSPQDQQQQQEQPQPGILPFDSYGSSTSLNSLMAPLEEPPVQQQPSSTTSSTTTHQDRQSALLSILSSPQTSTLNLSSRPAQGPIFGPQIQNSPTPPNPGQSLLQQLLGGSIPEPEYTEPAPQAPLPNPSPPAPFPILQGEPEQVPFPIQSAPAPVAPAPAPAPENIPQQSTPDLQQQQNQQSTPSPRKSMFDFVSPFDHLSSSSGSMKKKQGPPQPSGNEGPSWVTNADPKRQSVESLLEHISRGQASTISSQIQAPPSTYEPFDFSQPLESRVPPPPLPPKPLPQRTDSPRMSPPKTVTSATQRPQGRTSDSPVSVQNVPPPGSNGARRDKESSPIPRGVPRRGSNQQPKKPSPSPPSQTVVIDVSQPLDEIQATRDAIKSTPIALVKQESVFLPGTTIGATHWVAYAMTRGRVRVISRSSGDRTLLQLPGIFSQHASVTDMAVHGNRLAGITSDGGFVVWELPDMIQDDVPGTLIVCIPPSSTDGLHAVRWHPKDPDTLAVGSRNKIYLIDLAKPSITHGQRLTLPELEHLCQVFTVPSPVVSFDFDDLRHALATISIDSTLTIWNIHDHIPYSTTVVRGDGIPSSLLIIDNGIVIGRKNGTTFQLLSSSTNHILSSIKFVNGRSEDLEMFGHASYDSRINTLWIANSRRESLFAFKVLVEPTFINGEEVQRGTFDQVVEFGGQKVTIHFVILTADADPHGDEAHAACVAAKIQPGEVALVAFSVHAGGVDQLLIRKDWFDAALASTHLKLPSPDMASPAHLSIEALGPVLAAAPMTTAVYQQTTLEVTQARPRTPPSAMEDTENDFSRDEARAITEPKSRGKARNVNWKEQEDISRGAERNARPEVPPLTENILSQTLTKEMKKTEENLHTRIGRLISKEMEKQQKRMDDTRAQDQVSDFARQEKILKLISTELTRNTTRVVEVAVKNEVQNSVLPSLENITKTEVKAALNDQIGHGLMGYVSDSLPSELEKLLLRPDISAHFAHGLSTNLAPILTNQVHDAVTKTLLPMYNQQMNRLHQDVSQELRHELHTLKSELMSWQRDLVRNYESSIRDLEHNVRALSDHVKFLSASPASSLPRQQPHSNSNQNSPGPSGVSSMQGNMTQMHARQQHQPPASQVSANYGHKLGTLQQQMLPQPQQQHTWYPSTLAAPQASHPATIPQPPPPPPPPQTQPQAQPQPQPIAQQQSPADLTSDSDTWESLFLPAVISEDFRDLQILLARTNADVVMPLDRPGPLSQPVILTAMHRLAAIVYGTPPNDEAFKSAIWWLQRGVTVLDPKEQVVMEYLPNVMPGIYAHLNMTKQRLGLPGGPPSLEKARASVADTLAMLRRKGLQSFEGMEVPKK